MEYVITSGLGFDEIETYVLEALRGQGLDVQRTFSLRSAVGTSGDATARQTPQARSGGGEDSPGYSVLMLYGSGDPKRPVGLLTLYERGEQIVLNPLFTQPERGQPPLSGADRWADAEAELFAALAQSELGSCITPAEGEECIDVGVASTDDAQIPRLVQDPVCGRWIERQQAEAAIVHGERVYHVCCPLCHREFERAPGRYAQQAREEG